MNRAPKAMGKFIFHLHIVAAAFRLYLKETKDDELTDLLARHIKEFKEQEEKLAELAAIIGAAPAKKQSCRERRLIFVERLKTEELASDVRLATSALKLTLQELVAGLGLLHDSKNKLSEPFLLQAKEALYRGFEAEEELRSYILKHI